VPKFDKEGFRRLNQLTGDRITVEKLSEWLGIGKGTADLILRYAEEDITAIQVCAGAFQMPLGGVIGHGQNSIQKYFFFHSNHAAVLVFEDSSLFKSLAICSGHRLYPHHSTYISLSSSDMISRTPTDCVWYIPRCSIRYFP